MTQWDQFTDSCLSSPEASSSSASQDWDGEHSSDPHCSGMTQADEVSRLHKTVGSTRGPGYSVCRTSLASCLMIAFFNIIETQVLINRPPLPFLKS